MWRELLGQLGSSAGPLLLGVGRFAIEKRWDVVLRAFDRMRSRTPAANEARLILFGDGPERGRLEAMAPAGVAFAGFEKDRGRLASVLASADALVHGSPYETFGIGIAEAIACGLPVVVPDAGGACENVGDACAEIYASLDPEACAHAMERLLARAASAPDDERAIALRAASRALTLEGHAARVLSVYREILEREPCLQRHQRTTITGLRPRTSRLFPQLCLMPPIRSNSRRAALGTC